MAINLGSETIEKQERSASVTRVTPARNTDADAAAAVQLVIQRERVLRSSGGEVLGSTPISPAYVFSLAEMMASPAVAAYVAACGASSLIELMGREAAFYDALVIERNGT